MSNNNTLTPAFVVKIDGTRITVEQEAEKKDIIIEEVLDQPATMKFIVSDKNFTWNNQQSFEAGSEIEVSLGYKDEVEVVFTGEITGFETQMKQRGETVFCITARNLIHRLMGGKKTVSFTEQTDKEIIQAIAGDLNLSSEVEDIGQSHLFTVQKDQTDYEYLKKVASKYHCIFYVENKKLFFKKEKESSGETPVFEWGKTLIDFKAVQNTNQLFTEVQVNGWDHEKLEPITATQTHADIETLIGGDIPSGETIESSFGARVMMINDENVIDTESAEALAKDILTENSFQFITASVKVAGNPKLHTGGLVSMLQVGSFFEGDYRIHSVRHQMSSSTGYYCHLQLIRNAH